MNTHSKTVIDLINNEQDLEIRDEMRFLHNKYRQALAGLRLAQEQLKMIDDDCGTDHTEVLKEINSVIAFVKVSEIGLHEMVSEYAK